MNLKRSKYLEAKENLMMKTLINCAHQITLALSNLRSEKHVADMGGKRSVYGNLLGKAKKGKGLKIIRTDSSRTKLWSNEIH